VNYTLEESSDVLIEMYNVLGQEVFQILKGHQEAGTYSYPYHASENGIQPGVYMLKMTTGGKGSMAYRIVSVH
ncbi:MAG TPA: T9SS type A sorting domain-containing protein, partial [Bacteroidia bacterium]|nr:T9SS type A sorting domain-containing protein [Bacteroidia bacterium]